MSQDKTFVLETMRAQGLAQAQALQEKSPGMTGTELYAQEGYIPDFQAAKAAKNMLERKAGQTPRSRRSCLLSGALLGPLIRPRPCRSWP